MKTALLLSGGIDSSAIANWKKPDLCIFIDYGQVPATSERKAAKFIAEYTKSQFIEIKVDCSSIGAGTLANSHQLNMSPSNEWWPFRNQLLATLAGSVALKYEVRKLIFGSVKTDSFHVDGKAEFYENLNKLMSIQEGQIEVEAPALNLKCEDLVRVSKLDKSILFHTFSCHKSNFPCGTCEGCIKHYAVLDILGVAY